MTINNCRFCGQDHGAFRCPSIKAIEYFEDGITVKRVEFMTPSDYAIPATMPIYPQPPMNPTFAPSTTWGDGIAFDPSGRGRL